MPSFRRPTTRRTFNRTGGPIAPSYRREGESPFASLERTTIVRTRRAKDFVTTPKVQLGRYTARADSRLTNNPTGFALHNVIVHGGMPGKATRVFGPGLSRWGIPLGRRVVLLP